MVTELHPSIRRCIDRIWMRSILKLLHKHKGHKWENEDKPHFDCLYSGLTSSEQFFSHVGTGG